MLLVCGLTLCFGIAPLLLQGQKFSTAVFALGSRNCDGEERRQRGKEGGYEIFGKNFNFVCWFLRVFFLPAPYTPPMCFV